MRIGKSQRETHFVVGVEGADYLVAMDGYGRVIFVVGQVEQQAQVSICRAIGHHCHRLAKDRSLIGEYLQGEAGIIGHGQSHSGHFFTRIELYRGL